MCQSQKCIMVQFIALFRYGALVYSIVIKDWNLKSLLYISVWMKYPQKNELRICSKRPMFLAVEKICPYLEIPITYEESNAIIQLHLPYWCILRMCSLSPDGQVLIQPRFF